MSERGSSVSRYKILSVDDAPDNQFIVEEILEDLYEVGLVYSGEECLEKLKTFLPDMILMDVSMPGITGYETCQRIRETPALQDIPILFLSAHMTPEDKLKGYQAGGNDYITKPYDHEELIVKIKTILALSQKQIGLQAQLLESHSAAMSAMGYSSHLGVVVHFLEETFSCMTFEDLAQRLFQSTQSFGLSCSVQIHALEGVVDMTDCGAIYPLEQNVLTQGRNRGKFFEFGQKLIINHVHVSMLVKNMPLDPDKRVELKDILGVIINGLEARIKSIVSEAHLQTHQKAALQEIKGMMKNIDAQFREISQKVVTIVEDVMLEINTCVVSYDLDESQEAQLSTLTAKCIEKINENFFTGLRLESEVSQLVERLNQVVDK